MEIKLFETLLSKNVQIKIDTEYFLTDYYFLITKNKFRSAELAQNNIVNFLDIANKNIRDAKLSHTVSVFKLATKEIIDEAPFRRR